VFKAASVPVDVHFARNSPFGVGTRTDYFSFFIFLLVGLVYFFYETLETFTDLLLKVSLLETFTDLLLKVSLLLKLSVTFSSLVLVVHDLHKPVGVV